MINKENFCVEVNRSDIDRGHILSYLKLFTALEKKKQVQLANKIMFVYRGYKYEEATEIYKNIEFKKWARRLFKNKPHIFYYLCEHTSQDIYMAMSEFEEFSTNGDRVIYKIKYNESLSNKVIFSALKHSVKRKDSLEVQGSVGVTIVDSLYPDMGGI
ncbi:hypothetical protein [Evansella cellulosilytica]|uniref:Uncharacterized protein n=1 Tax=Evansella cellulosilytica (strain ATCC 21833 / DSM 2522 / FERM P-1141 / JCM 9156 / N-4) TaxID=649639 RepID=E6TZ56_EVAC2|nr:hypothetical protein [Evansella cellulosilytica]ADU32499.1 hypothetical protein Bcell_4272 [Evansella cellulosilytica DSM 2522]